MEGVTGGVGSGVELGAGGGGALAAARASCCFGMFSLGSCPWVFFPVLFWR